MVVASLLKGRDGRPGREDTRPQEARLSRDAAHVWAREDARGRATLPGAKGSCSSYISVRHRASLSREHDPRTGEIPRLMTGPRNTHDKPPTNPQPLLSLVTKLESTGGRDRHGRAEPSPHSDRKRQHPSASSARKTSAGVHVNSTADTGLPAL